MAVYKQTGPDGKDRYLVDVLWKYADGRRKRIRRMSPIQTRRGAENYEREVRNALQDGTFEKAKPGDDLTLAAFQARYFRDHVSKLKASSRSAQETIFRVSLLPVLGGTALAQIDGEAIAALTRSLQAREAMPKTINNALSSLRSALSKAEEWKLIGAVPRIHWLKVPQQGFDFFSFDETAKLLEHAPPLVVLALRTGMRVGELLAVKWSDVSLERKQVNVARSVFWEKGKAHEAGTKSGKVRTIPLTSDALAALESMSKGKGYVFTDANGLQLTRNEAKHPLWRACEAAGLRRVGWHVCRHTFCSHLAMRGVALPAIQALAGHATIQMTMRYAHLQPDHLRSAIDVLG
jgi:integrase